MAQQTWKKRWFVLRPTRLSYYKNEKEYELLAIIQLQDITSIAHIPSTSRPLVFGLVTRSRTFYLQAPNEGLLQHWLNTLKETHGRACHGNSPVVGSGNTNGQQQARRTLIRLPPNRTGSLTDQDAHLARSASPPGSGSGFASIQRTYSRSVPTSATSPFMPPVSLLDPSREAGDTHHALRSPPSITSSLLTATTTVTTATTGEAVPAASSTQGILLRSGTMPVPIQGSVSFSLPPVMTGSSGAPRAFIAPIAESQTVEDQIGISPLSDPSPVSEEYTDTLGLAELRLLDTYAMHHNHLSSDEEVDFEPETPGIFMPELEGLGENPDAILKQGFLKKQSVTTLGRVCPFL